MPISPGKYFDKRKKIIVLPGFDIGHIVIAGLDWTGFRLRLDLDLTWTGPRLKAFFTLVHRD